MVSSHARTVSSCCPCTTRASVYSRRHARLALIVARMPLSMSSTSTISLARMSRMPAAPAALSRSTRHAAWLLGGLTLAVTHILARAGRGRALEPGTGAKKMDENIYIKQEGTKRQASASGPAPGARHNGNCARLLFFMFSMGSARPTGSGTCCLRSAQRSSSAAIRPSARRSSTRSSTPVFSP